MCGIAVHFNSLGRATPLDLALIHHRGPDSSGAWSSPDGLTWAKEPRAIPCSVAWARDGLLGLGFSWGDNIHASRDLVEWKRITVPSGPSFNAVAFGAP